MAIINKNSLLSFNLFQVFRGSLQSAFIGYFLDKKHNGKGYTTEAVQLIVEYSFNISVGINKRTLLLTILFGISAILYRATETGGLGYLGMMLLQIICFVGIWAKRKELFNIVSTQ